MRAQLLLVVGATLVPFAIFAIYVFTEQETAMQRGQTGGALEAAALVGGRFDERLRGLDILLLSVADAIGQDNDARNIQRKLETLKQADKGFFERILFVDDAGHVVASLDSRSRRSYVFP